MAFVTSSSAVVLINTDAQKIETGMRQYKYTLTNISNYLCVCAQHRSSDHNGVDVCMDIRGDYPTSAFPCIGLGSGAGAFVQSGTLFCYLEKKWVRRTCSCLLLRT